MNIPNVTLSPGAQRVGVRLEVILALSVLVSACVSPPPAVAVTLEKFEVAVPGIQFPTRTALQLKATAFYSDGSKVNVTQQTAWSTLDANVAVIGKSGIAQLEGVGQARFEAHFADRVVPVNVEVTGAELESLTLIASSSVLAAGETRTFIARAGFSDGSSLDVTDHTTWIVEGALSLPGAPGVVKGLGEGTGIVRGLYYSQQATMNVSVSAPRFIEISFEGPVAPLKPGASHQLALHAIFSDGSRRDVSAESAWSSSNANVADVAPTGMIFAREPGQARITARWNDATSSRELMVDARQPIGLHFAAPELQLSQGSAGAIELIVDFDDGTSVKVTSEAQWSTSDLSTALVDAKGEVSTVSMGAATITARFGDYVASFDVFVNAPALISLDTTLKGGRLSLGQTANFIVTGRFSDGSVLNLSSAAVLRHGLEVSSMVENDRVKLSAAQLGVADVQLEVGGMVERISFEVSAAQLIGIEIVEYPAQVGITPGLLVESPHRFIAVAEYSDGVMADATELCTWSVADQSIGLVSDLPGRRGYSDLALGGQTSVRATMAGVDSAIDWDFPARP